MIGRALLGLVPLTLVVGYTHLLPPVLVFALGAASIGVLADWIRRATEQLASRTGVAIGSLLNVTLGSLAELVLAFFVLRQGDTDVVRAQMIGSILGTTLLGLGLAMMAGGLTRAHQQMRRERAGLLGGLLVLVVIALALPAAFELTVRTASVPAPRIRHEDELLSLGVAALLLLLYAGNLVFTLVTHRDVFAAGAPDGGRTPWSLQRALGVLGLATVAASALAELVSGALGPTAHALKLSTLFLGVVPLALVGTAPDLVAAVAFARADRVGLAADVCIGSAVQVSLVILPLLAIGSWFVGPRLSLVFSNPLELFGIVAAAFAINVVAIDGETNWFEGLLLVGIYALLALAFFFVG